MIKIIWWPKEKGGRMGENKSWLRVRNLNLQIHISVTDKIKDYKEFLNICLRLVRNLK